jgi:uncharacterized membrane protein YkoI
MNNLKTIVCAVAVLTSAAAFAENAKTASNDAGPIVQAKISMGTAVAAAEKHTNGKAVRAEYEKGKSGRWEYDVEVASGSDVFDVKVDPDAGAIIASTKDAADADDEGDKAD